MHREAEEEANAIVDAGMREVDAKMQEAVTLKRNTEALAVMLSDELAKTKRAQEDAAKHQHDADDAKKAADDAKKAADDQIKLMKDDRARYKTRFVEILAHDPCGQPAAAH